MNKLPHIDYAFLTKMDPKIAKCRWDIIQWSLEEIDWIIHANASPDICHDCKYVIECMQHQTKNLLNKESKLNYAKKVLTDIQFNTIEVKWILDENMTIEKINTLSANYLSDKQIKTLWWKFLANKEATFSKFIIIWMWFSNEDIINVWREELLKMDIHELSTFVPETSEVKKWKLDMRIYKKWHKYWPK